MKKIRSDNEVSYTPEELASLSGESLIKYLRGLLAGNWKGSTCLRTLNDMQLAEVYQRMRLNQSMERLTKLVISDWNLMRNTKPEVVKGALKKLYDKVVPPLLQKPERLKSGTKTPKKAAELEEYQATRKRNMAKMEYHLEQLDALGRLRWVIDQQTERVCKWRELEKMTPIAAVSKDIRLLGDLCEKAVRIEMDLGVRDRRPNEIIIDHKHRFEAFLAGTPDDGNSLVIAAGKLLESIDEGVVALIEREDGSYGVEELSEEDRAASYAFGICGGIGSRYNSEEQSGGVCEKLPTELTEDEPDNSD